MFPHLIPSRPLNEPSRAAPIHSSVSGTDFSSGESASNVKDNNVNTKYYNSSQDGTYPRGVNAGFVIAPKLGATIINGFQFATANDVPARDPIFITIEGSNATNANESGSEISRLFGKAPPVYFRIRPATVGERS